MLMEMLGLGERSKEIVDPSNDECGASDSLVLLYPSVLVFIKMFPLYHVHPSLPGLFVVVIIESMFLEATGHPLWICCLQVPVTFKGNIIVGISWIYTFRTYGDELLGDRPQTSPKPPKPATWQQLQDILQ